MNIEHIINRIKDEIIAASAAIEEPEGSDRFALMVNAWLIQIHLQ